MRTISLITLLLTLPLVCFGQDSEIDRLLDEQEYCVNKYERLMIAASTRAEFLPLTEQFEKEAAAWQKKFNEEINKSGHTWSKEK
jgi:hypothetical protein